MREEAHVYYDTAHLPDGAQYVILNGTGLLVMRLFVGGGKGSLETNTYNGVVRGHDTRWQWIRVYFESWREPEDIRRVREHMVVKLLRPNANVTMFEQALANFEPFLPKPENPELSHNFFLGALNQLVGPKGLCWPWWSMPLGSKDNPMIFRQMENFAVELYIDRVCYQGPVTLRVLLGPSIVRFV